MTREGCSESCRMHKRIFKPPHELPGELWWDYILLPYGIFYKKTKSFLDAKKGDILRFFNGPDVEIESVSLIEDAKTCSILCNIRYGVPWPVALSKWERYAIMEGNSRGILSRDKCILIIFKRNV